MPTIARRLWDLLSEPRSRAEIDLHFGRDMGASLRSARGNGHVRKPVGDAYVRGPEEPSLTPQQPQQGIALRNIPALVARVPASVFDLGSRL